MKQDLCNLPNLQESLNSEKKATGKFLKIHNVFWNWDISLNEEGAVESIC